MIEKKKNIDEVMDCLEKQIIKKKMEIESLRQENSNPKFIGNLASTAMDKINISVENFQHLFAYGQGGAKVILEKLQIDLKQEPWKFLGKVALYSFGAGLVLNSLYKQHTKTSEK